MTHSNKAFVRLITLASAATLILVGCATASSPATEVTVDAVTAAPTGVGVALPALDRAAPVRVETATFALG